MTPRRGILFLLFGLLLTQPAAAAEPYGGVGVQVVPISSGELAVLHVVADSPAESAGLLAGDLIIEVDGHAMKGSDFDSVTRKYLWGEVGSSVHLIWLRPGQGGRLEATLVRVVNSGQLKARPTPGVTIKTPK